MLHTLNSLFGIAIEAREVMFFIGVGTSFAFAILKSNKTLETTLAKE